jgi:hypothetical protein
LHSLRSILNNIFSNKGLIVPLQSEGLRWL